MKAFNIFLISILFRSTSFASEVHAVIHLKNDCPPSQQLERSIILASTRNSSGQFALNPLETGSKKVVKVTFQKSQSLVKPISPWIEIKTDGKLVASGPPSHLIRESGISVSKFGADELRELIEHFSSRSIGEPTASLSPQDCHQGNRCLPDFRKLRAAR